jgi:multiple sugar transport system permease protein
MRGQLSLRPVEGFAFVSRRRLTNLTPYLFVLPSLFLTLAFVAGPTLAGFGLSLTDWDLRGTPQFVGIENYLRFPSDPRFGQSVTNTLFFTAALVALVIGIGFLLAVLLDNRVRGIGIYRTAVITPLVVTPVAASTLWLWVYNPQVGLVNGLLGALGIDGPDWLFDTTLAMPAVIFMTVWMEVGFAVIIFLAAFQTVPRELHEAAEIDGATQLQQWRHITAPLVAPATLLLVIVMSIRGFQAFDQFYVMTKGGPLGSTRTLSLYVFETAFRSTEVGYATAMAWFLALLVFLIVFVQWRLRRRWVYGE